jgi:multidrug efflux pump subunit AcrA (membrane-fusion protein)
MRKIIARPYPYMQLLVQRLIYVGQPVTVRVDAVPGGPFSGKITQISALAKIDFSAGWPPTRNFEFDVRLSQIDSRMRPGMTASIRAAVDRTPGSILIPARAAFERGGETLAYVLQGTRFIPQAIEVAQRGEEDVAVESGLHPGERVALQDPTAGR